MQNNTDSCVYAGFFVRLSAYLIDWLIVSAALLIVRVPIWIANLSGAADLVFADFIFKYSVYDIVLYLLKTAYFVLLTYFTGSTLGKKLLQIRVISTEDRKPTFFEIAFRESVGKFLSALVLYVGYFMIGADKKKQGLHDMLSDTCVVYRHQKTIPVPAPIAYQTVPYQMPRPQTPPYQAGVGMGGSFGAGSQQQFPKAGMPQGVQQINQNRNNMPQQMPMGMPQSAQQINQNRNNMPQQMLEEESQKGVSMQDTAQTQQNSSKENK